MTGDNHILRRAKTHSRHRFLFLLTLVTPLACAQPVAISNTGFWSILPDRLGEYSRTKASPIPISDRATHWDLLNEYGLKARERAVYVNAPGRRMDAEVLRFGDSEGAHAAYLCLRPTRAVGSPLDESSDKSGVFGHTSAVLGKGVTVVGRKNYVFRFRGGAPESRDLGSLLDHLPGLDAAEPSADECCRYFEQSSERRLLGPVSLARFAGRVPPEVAALQVGVRGRVARFETPAGPMSRIVLEYPSPGVAQERYTAFRSLPGARARLANRKVGVIFYPTHVEEADELLADIEYDRNAAISFDPYVTDEVTFDGAMATVVAGSLLGCLIAVLRRLARWGKGIPDRTIALHLGKG